MVATEQEREIRGKSARGHRTVVCVDDEPFVSRALYRLLSRESYDVLIADTPAQALKYVRDFDIDLVISDQLMPDMSGVELLQAVREVSPLTAGLILTAYPESVLGNGPPEGRTPPLVTKPWDDQTLRVAVQELLAGPAEERVPRGREASEDLLWPGETVLVPLDGTTSSEAALTAILPLVRARSMKIELVRVIREMGLHPDIHAYVEKAWKGLAQSGLPARGKVRWGDPVEEILHEARHPRVGLIALSTGERTPLPAFFHESVSDSLIRRAPVPLLLSRPGRVPDEWKRILVPLDGSQDAETILPEAVRLAKDLGALLEIVRVGSASTWATSEFGQFSLKDHPEPYLEEIRKVVEAQEVPVRTVTMDGQPSWEIVHYAECVGAHLICMTTRGRGRLERVLVGGVAEAVIRNSPCPVYVRRVSPPSE